MITISIILSVIIFLSLIALCLNGYNKKYTFRKILLQSTLLLFLFTILLLVTIGYLEKRENDLYLFNKNINEGLILFSLWYYLIPPIFLIVTIIAYSKNYLKQRFK